MVEVGFAGLGLMGAPMVRRLLNAGVACAVWNRSRDKMDALVAAGARGVATPHELGGNVVMLCLMDAGSVEHVVFGADGIAGGLRAGCVLVDFSSIAPDATRRFAARLREQTGAGWIDAPVSGGTVGAERGTLAVMAGGDAAELDRVRPMLAHLSGNVTHVGPCGAGQTAKLCNQIVAGCTMAIVGEAVRLAEASGIDAGQLATCMRGGFADSALLQVFAPRMAARDFVPPVGSVATILKDLDTVLDVARVGGTALPMTALAAELIRHLGNIRGRQVDPGALVQLYDR